MLRTFFKLLMVAVLLAAIWLAWGLWLPVHPAQATYVQLRPGWSTRHIAAELQSAGVIHSARAFLLYHYIGHPKTLKAGEYKFDESASPIQIHRRLVSGDILVHREGSGDRQCRSFGNRARRPRRIGAHPCRTGRDPGRSSQVSAGRSLRWLAGLRNSPPRRSVVRSSISPTVRLAPRGLNRGEAWPSTLFAKKSRVHFGLIAGNGGFAPLPGDCRRNRRRSTGPTSESEAGKGLHRHHIPARLARPTGRAWIGSPPRHG